MSTDTAPEAGADTETVTEADHVDVEAANASDAATGTKSTGTARGEHPKFPAIADYAFLSDCEVNCLIAPSGAVEWMCAPRPDSPSFFSSLLDRSAGSFRVGPFDLKNTTVRDILNQIVSQHSNGAWVVQQPPWTMGKDLGYGLWKVLEYDRTDAEYSRELQVRGLGLQTR